MGTIALITGGTRSGKSDFALRLGEEVGGSLCFIATCRVMDEEMAERVKKHRLTRDAAKWTTVEEPLDIANILAKNEHSAYLVDCLTLWISNLMAAGDGKGKTCCEKFLGEKIERLVAAAKNVTGSVIFVSNEVGMGIVPENELARKFRDLVGTTNRLVAAAADEVVLISCGLPIFLKKS